MEPLKQLPFRLPDFTRMSWTSDRARAVWEPRIKRISEAWSQIEWLSVADGVRCCALMRMSPERFVASTGRWADRRVSALGLAREALSQWPYSTNAVKAAPGRPFVLCVGLGKLGDLGALKSAFDMGDDAALGRLLGYPECCCTFFREVWKRDGCIDTTWPMAVNSISEKQEPTRIEVRGPYAANVLWRWAGIRAVPHLPCSFGCTASVSFAEQLRDVGERSGFSEEMQWLEEILGWPVEWSALHGIAEIKTPILRVSTRTDATGVKYVVRRNGERYPEEGATALRFPYRQASMSRGGKQDLGKRRQTPLQPQFDRLAWYHSDNGFASRQAMDVAHGPIVELAVSTLGERPGAVLDLGCGNGVLLKKVRDRMKANVLPFGIDVEPSRIRHARDLLPAFASHFQVGNMFSAEPPWQTRSDYALVLLAVRRLLEVRPEDAARLRKHLARQRVLLYVYGAEDELPDDVAVLAARAGLRLSAVGTTPQVALAEVP